MDKALTNGFCWIYSALNGAEGSARARLARKRNEGGFTLLELLVVMVIVGILAAITIPVIQHFADPDGVESAKRQAEREAAAAAREPIEWGAVGFVALWVVIAIAAAYATYALVRRFRASLNVARDVGAQWNHSLNVHNEIRDEYAAILLDPVKSLNHSALWDVHNVRTSNFIKAYAKCQDVATLWRDKQPNNPATVEQYAEDIRQAKIAWDDASKYAAHLGYNWMASGDAKNARQAVALLNKAADQGASEAERSLASLKAKELIDSIGSVQLRVETMEAILTLIRGELTAAVS